MSIFPVLPARIIIAILSKAGFVVVRQTGSHVRLVHPSDPSRYATVSSHSKPLSRGNIASILRQAKISPKEFLRLLKD